MKEQVHMATGSVSPGQDDADLTADVPRRAFPIQVSKLPMFLPPGDRTLEGLRRFLLACTTDPPDFEPSPAALAPKMTRAEVVHVGDPDRFVLELIVIQAAGKQFAAVYKAPPPDLFTRLPELHLVDLKRCQARLLGPAPGDFQMSALTVDNVTHLIILSRLRSQPDAAQTPGEEIEIDVEFDDEG